MPTHFAATRFTFAARRLTHFIAIGGLLFVAIGCGSSSQSRLPAEARNPDAVSVFAIDIVTLHDFEQRYERTTGSIDAARDDSLSQYQDFLERYVDFRLKVRAAEEAGIAELTSLQNERRTYRANLAR